jgi:hypothetical protein
MNFKRNSALGAFWKAENWTKSQAGLADDSLAQA